MLTHILKTLTLSLILLTTLSSSSFADAQIATRYHFVTSSGTGDCSQADPCSLERALSRVDNQSFHTIYMGAGNYTGTNDEVMLIQEGEVVNILGGWDGTTTTPVVLNPKIHVTVIDGEGTRGGITLGDNLWIRIKGITVTNALTDRPGSGLVVDRSNSLTLENVIFSNNSARTDIEDYMYGGAVYVRGGTLSIENCTFTNNWADGKKSAYGGALAIIEANASILGSTFQENRSWEDSALFFHGISSSSLGTLELNDNIFNANGVANGSAYRILKLRYADAEIRHNSFTNNKSSRADLMQILSSKLIFTNNIISNNSSGKVAALYIYNTLAFKVGNNIIADNNSTGSSYPAIQTLLSTGLFAHNTIANNDTDFAILIGYVEFSNDHSNIGLVNNIITGHPTGIYVGDGTEINAESTLWGDLTQTDGQGTINTVNDYTGNPDFKDGYHIGANSVAKDAGVMAGIFTDIDGDTRPQGNGYDIGADEFVNSSASPALIMYLLN